MKTFSTCRMHGDYDDHVHPMCPACRAQLDAFITSSEPVAKPTAYELEDKLRRLYRECDDDVRAACYIHEDSRPTLASLLEPTRKDAATALYMQSTRLNKLTFRWGVLDIRSSEAIAPGWMLLVGANGDIDAIKLEETPTP